MISLLSLGAAMTGVRFDKTINLGHVLTFLGFMAAMWVASTTFHTRIVLLEERQRLQELRDSQQDSQTREARQEMQSALRDVHNSIEKLTDKLTQQPQSRR